MNIKALLRKTGMLVRYNFQCLARLEIAYRVLSVFLFIPAFALGFKMVMKMGGYSYLTKENILGFLMNPLMILLLLGLLLIIAVVEVFHIGTIIFILDQSAQQKKTTVFSALNYAVKNNKYFWQNGKIKMMVYLLFVLPFLNLGTGIIGSIRIPEFIMDTIMTYGVLTALLGTVYLLLIICVLRWVFALHYVIIEKDGFASAAKRSSQLAKGSLLRIIGAYIVSNVIIIIVFGAVVLLGEGLITLLFKANLFTADVLISINGMILAILVVLFSALAIPISLGMIAAMFYEKKEQHQEKIVHIICEEQEKDVQKGRKKRRALGVGFLIVFIVLGALFVRGIRHGDYNLNIEHIRTMEVSAHRGASAFYPENTMAAFRGAVLQNADWAELDVQQSSDGEIFVMHDTNFLRTTGVDKGCWEMTWSEISKLDAGSFFSEEYKGEPIPLLEEVVSFAKLTGLRLNIELKPTGHETDFEKKVIDIIQNNDFADSCVITSQEYQVLENIKKLDPSIRTVYVMAVAVGDIEKLECADDFSIEATFVTEDLVNRMHKLGKEVYAWTIDTEENINTMIDIGVDNIITNNVPLAKACIEKSRTSNLIDDLMEKILYY